MAGLATLVAGKGAAGAGEAEARYPGRLIFRDIERFRAAYARTKRGTPTLSAMEWYVAGGTEGLKAYLKAYSVRPTDIAASLSSHPQLYEKLTEIRDRVAAYASDIARAALNLRLLVPAMPEVPIYFFVGALGHGATVKEVGAQELGVLVPIENLAASRDTRAADSGRDGRTWASLDDLPQLTTHELGHVAQIQYQGLDRYRMMYGEQSRGSHLAYAIREGGADFMSHLAARRLRARHHYLLEREAELWREFSKLLYEPASASSGWFSGLNERTPNRPPQLGYAIGWSICTRFYERSTDKAVALRDILSANEIEVFERIVAPYRQAFS